MEDVYVVSDVHGNYDALEKALYDAELIDTDGRRNMNKKSRNAFIIQIGDLVNAVGSGADDFKCISKVGSWIDLLLIGNHEIPYFDSSNSFLGFRFNNEVSRILHRLLDEDGLMRPCYAHGDTLISHAGITKPQLNFGTGTTAQEVSDKIHREFLEQNFQHYLFSDVGRARYGPNGYGGILWCDFDKEFVPTDFPQIVGHTPGVLRQKGNALCIDTIRSAGVPTVLKLEG